MVSPTDFDDPPPPMVTALQEAFDKLDALGYEPEWESGQIRARCLDPLHLDSNPSMTMSLGANDRLIVYCHSRGCDGQSMLDNFNAGVVADEPDEAARQYRRHGAGAERQLGSYVRHHDWYDLDSNPVARHIKYSSGWIWRTLTDSGVSMGGLNGRKLDSMPLYGGPLLAMRLSVQHDATVYYCEGEKDAEAATDAGGIGTCDAGIPPRDLSVLGGRHVVIVADRDEGGIKRANRTNQALSGVAASITIALPAVHEVGADLSDHLAAGFTLEQLETPTTRKIMAIAEQVASMLDVSISEAEEATRKALIREAIGEISEQIEAEEKWEALNLPEPLAASVQEGDDEANWAIDELVHADGGTMLVASAKAGKTTAALHLCRSLLTGSKFLDGWEANPIPNDKKVLWLDTEMGPLLSAWARRVLGDAADRLVTWHLRGKTGSMDIRQEAIRAGIASKVAGIDVGYLVVDVLGAWATSLGLDENSNSEMRSLVEGIISLGTELGCQGVLVTHHMGHSFERARGASALLDWTHSSLYLTKTKVTENKKGSEFDDPIDADNGIRWLSAEGREVDLPKTPLHFDPDTWEVRVATDDEVAEAVPSRQSRAEIRMQGKINDVLRVLSEAGPQTVNALREALQMGGRYRKVFDTMLERGLIVETVREDGSKLISLTNIGAATA